MNISRAASIPIITHDPYFSIWCPWDHLYDGDLEHWSGIPQPIRGSLSAGGETFCFMGSRGTLPVIPQTGLAVTATATEYTFSNDRIRLTVRFTSPLVLTDRNLVSRPCTYVDFTLDADVSAEITVSAGSGLFHTPSQPMNCFCCREEAFSYACMGPAAQKPLGNSGDRITADWGYYYLASREPGCVCSRDRDSISLGLHFDGQKKTGTLVIAWDDLLSINYMGQWRKALWTETWETMPAAIGAALADQADTLRKAAAVDEEIRELALARGGEDYAFLCAMSYRQSIAAHKLVRDEAGNILFLSKENDSNGCIGTVDVSYPSVPLYLMYDQEYVKGMLRPIFEFARCPAWEYDSAPHDMGRYPYAWGEVYSLPDHRQYAENGDIYPPFCQFPKGSGLYADHRQMPVEECGNMLIMTAAVCLRDGKPDFAAPYLDLLEQWTRYLEQYGADPGNQLCTDDFAGHLSHNANLSLKAIMGIEAWSILLDMSGRRPEARRWHALAGDMAASWEARAKAGDHYVLAFGSPDSWSLKYNLVWDRLFSSHLFSHAVISAELAGYQSHSGPYGVPLDSRNSYTKSDWIAWCAAMAPDRAGLEALMKPVADYLRASPSRVPFSDFYDTRTGASCGFRGRSVQGGIFMPLLKPLK